MDLQAARSYLQSKYQFRFNMVNGQVECFAKGNALRVLDERLINDIWIEVNEGEGRLSIANLKRLLYSSSIALPYDPFLAYLEGLSSWTPDMSDYLEQLASTIETDEPELFKTYLRKWFIAMVGSLFSEEVANHTALILSGPQGIGKTRWFNAIVPSVLQSYCYLGQLPGSQELDILLSNSLLINLDELAGCGARKVSQLKMAITKEYVSKLIPYQRHYQRVPRRASFAGTVNGGDFLHDETGNRRFLVVEATKIEVDHGIDIDLVYAQALHLYLTGEQFWFDPEEIFKINKINTAYQKWTLEEEALLTIFEQADEHDHTEIAMTSDIMRELATHPADFEVNISNASQRAIGLALRKHGFNRVKREGRYKYLLKRK